MAKILAAMSGGVDSSVAAAVLVQAGHEVVGVYMKNWINEENIVGHCPWEEDIDDARAVAEQLGIEFRVVNLMREYREKVVKYLLEGYQNGITPNPDVMCNREMKFGVLLAWAKDHGFNSIATGHYARRAGQGALLDSPQAIALGCEGEPHILRGADPNKDQTYFLAMLQPHQVAAAQFPIGHLLKPELRELARKYQLKTAEKKDSQGICFIGEVKMTDFLRAFVPDKPGPIVNLEGKTLGQHSGLHLYTLGQRKGLGVASNLYKEAYVVVAKRHENNELVIAIERPDTPLLWAKRCTLTSLNSLIPEPSEARQTAAGCPQGSEAHPFPNSRIPELSEARQTAVGCPQGSEAHPFPNSRLTEPRILHAQPRYRAPAALATYTPFLRNGEWCAELEFHTPQRALTPGQICALYDGERLLGGSVFESIEY